MFARLVTFTLEPGNGSLTVRLADEQDPVIRSLPGFVSLAFFHDDVGNRYGSFSVWQTREQAQAVGSEARLQVKNTLKSCMSGRPAVVIYEIYEPKP